MRATLAHTSRRRARVVDSPLPMMLPLALIVVPFLVAPALFGLVASFTNYAPLQSQVRFVGLANFAAALHDSQTLIAFRNVAVLCAVAVPLELCIGFALAYLLRRDFRGRGLVRVAMLIPWLVGPIANGVMWHFLFNTNIGLLNFLLSLFGLPSQPSPLGARETALLTIILTEVWRTTPLAAFLLLPAITAIPADHWEQATLDGAPLLGRMRVVVLPAVQPVLLALAMLLVGQALGTFDGVWVMTGGGPGTATVTPGLLSFQFAFNTNQWQLGAAYAWWIMLSVALLGLAYVRLARTAEAT